ncbi:MAG TPA: hypothetical protein VF723_00535 [Pyrinomonadaceae bacterium]|jgi:hypothetical protein
MREGTKARGKEPAGNWKRLVQAVWTLNYISVGFKGLLSRMGGLTESLDEVAALIPALEEKATADVLERELKEKLAQFGRAHELLSHGSARLRELLRQLEEQRANLNER